jgi:hypothetical protein
MDGSQFQQSGQSGRLAGGINQAFKQWKSARDWGQNFNQGDGFPGAAAKDPDIARRAAERNDGIAIADAQMDRLYSTPPI